MTARHIVIAGAVGLALGAVIGISPAGSVCLAALGGLVWWAARTLRGVERRWVIGWLTLAVAARVAVVLLLPLTVDRRVQSIPTIFGGDAFYAIQRSTWIANAFTGAPFAPRDFFEAFEPSYGWSGYNYVLALLHVFFGPSPYATHLLSAVLSLAAAVVIFRYVRRSYGRAAAFIGIAALTTAPSLFLWSVAPLKEAPFNLLTAITAIATLALARPRRWWQLPAGAIGVAVALAAIRSVRPEWAILTAVAVAAGLIGWLAYSHRRIALAAAAVAVFVAIGFGASPRANTLVSDALGAAARRHLGSVSGPGHSFALLDPDAYAWDSAAIQGRRALARFVVRGTVRFFSVPEPWILKPGLELLLIPPQMIWYVMLALAGVGVVAGMRRDPLLTSVCAAFVLVGAAAIGLNSGNVGTLIRHRDAVVPFALWLSAVGGVTVLSGGTGRTNRLDASVVVPCLAMALGYASYLLFRSPAPRPESVTPATVYTPTQVILRGQHLRPYLRALLTPTGQAPETRDRHPRSPEAVYAVRTTAEAQLTLPGLPPGQYDLVLFDAGDEVALLSRAFTVSRMAGDPTGVVIVDGRFTRLDPAAKVAVGDAVTSSDGAKVVDVLQIGADRPDIEEIGPGQVKTWVRLDDTVQRPATLKLRCTFATVRCYFMQQPVVADGVLTLPFLPHTLSFMVDSVRPDAAAWTVPESPTADAVVDFIGWPGAQQWIHAGDRDSRGPHARSLRPASIIRIVATEPFVGNAGIDGPMPDQQLAFQAPLIRVRAIVRYPRLPSGDLDFRGADVRAGSHIAFETAAYVLRGTIVNLLPEGAPRP